MARLDFAMTEEDRRERNREAQRRWYAAHRDAAQAASRERMRRARAADPERFRARGRRWAAANRELVRTKYREWRKANRDAERERQRAWRAANPDRVQANARLRRERERALRGQVRPDIEEVLLRLQRGRCWHCGVALGATGYQRDHLKPLALRGEHDDSNLALACPPCNQSRGATDACDWGPLVYHALGYVPEGCEDLEPDASVLVLV